VMATYTSKYNGSFGLIIGIDQYQHVTPPGTACEDAKSVAHFLTAALSFPNKNVLLLLNKKATRQRILSTFSNYDRLGPDDRLFVFFAGHGSTADGQRGLVGYLLPVDGSPDDKSTLIRWDEPTRNADLIPAKHILFIMDACYSGLAMQ